MSASATVVSRGAPLWRPGRDRDRTNSRSVPVHPRRGEDRGRGSRAGVARTDPARVAPGVRVPDARVATPRDSRGPLADRAEKVRPARRRRVTQRTPSRNLGAVVGSRISVVRRWCSPHRRRSNRRCEMCRSGRRGTPLPVPSQPDLPTAARGYVGRWRHEICRTSNHRQRGL